jgi:hypothetical protein
VPEGLKKGGAVMRVNSYYLVDRPIVVQEREKEGEKNNKTIILVSILISLGVVKTGVSTLLG